MIRLSRFLYLVAASACIMPTPFLRAQQDLREIPAGAVAWWYFDPSGFAAAEGADPKRALVEGAIRAAFAAGLIEDEDAARSVAGVLGASVAGRHAHRGVLLSFEASPGEARDDGYSIDDLALVFELRGGDQKTLLRTVRSIVVDAERAGDGGDGEQRVIELPGGRRGVAYREHDWEAWREVSWCSTPGAFHVGLGEGSLDAWFSPAQNEHKHWIPHRDLVEDARPAGQVFFELYVDLDALRDGFPEAFAGRLGDQIDTWRIANARDFMLHARRVEPGVVSREAYTGPALLAFDATWSARSLKPGTVARESLSTDFWPDEIGFDPPPGSYAIVFQLDWLEWLDRAMDTYRATRRGFSRLKHDAHRKRWERVHLSELKRVFRALGPWVVLSDVPEPIAAMPGLTTVFAECKPGAPRSIGDDLASAIGSVTEGAEYDEDADLWNARLLPRELDPGGFLRLLSWGFAGDPERPVLLLGWGPSSVTENRERMGH